MGNKKKLERIFLCGFGLVLFGTYVFPFPAGCNPPLISLAVVPLGPAFYSAVASYTYLAERERDREGGKGMVKRPTKG